MKSVLALVAIMTLVPLAAGAQTRRGASARRPAAAQTAPAVDRAAAEKIGRQAKALSGFLYAYGGVVKGIETADQAARESGSPASTIARIKKNKAAVVASIRGLQPGLRQLESDLQADPSLRAYSRHVNGLADDVGLAADLAAADRFDEAGKKLLDVVGVLLDALLPPAP